MMSLNPDSAVTRVAITVDELRRRGCSSVGVQLTSNPKNVLLGNSDLGEQRFLRHAVVALSIRGRHMALVTKKNKDLFPWKLLLRIALILSQQGIDAAWS